MLNNQSSSSSLQDQMLREFAAYQQKGRITDLPPLRLMLALALLLVCLACTLFFALHLKDHAQISLAITAAKKGDLVRMKELVAGKASLVDAAGYSGRTPLWWAAAGGQVDVIKYCLEKKADLNHQDTDGWTPLHAAAAHNQVAALQLLCQYRADWTLRDKLGRTILHAAATGTNPDTITALIGMGFSPDLVDNAGWTPLHVAVFARQSKMVSLLLANHASINLKTKDGLTPLGVANRMKHNDAIIDILMNNGGDM